MPDMTTENVWREAIHETLDAIVAALESSRDHDEYTTVGASEVWAIQRLVEKARAACAPLVHGSGE